MSTTVDLAALLRMSDYGLPVRAIAAQLGVSEQTVRNARHAAGWVPHGPTIAAERTRVERAPEYLADLRRRFTEIPE